MERQYTIILDPNPDESMDTVTVPALPGCVTEGATPEECIANAREAIALWIADALDHGEPIPEETLSPQVIKLSVSIPVGVAA
jgi:antitoxin HicB